MEKDPEIIKHRLVTVSSSVLIKAVAASISFCVDRLTFLTCKIQLYVGD